MIRHRGVALVWRLACLAFSLLGVLAVSGLLEGEWQPGMFAYYTILSNLLAVALFAMLSVRTAAALRREGPVGGCGWFARFEMVCVIDILLTFLVYWVLLAPRAFSMGGGAMGMWTFSNLAVHAVTPLLCLADYLLFAESGHLRGRDVFLVAAFPLAYVAGTSLMGLGGYVFRVAEDGPVRFPYFFFDYDRVGWLSLAWIAALVAVFLSLGGLLYLLDKKVKKPALFPRGR